LSAAKGGTDRREIGGREGEGKVFNHTETTTNA